MSFWHFFFAPNGQPFYTGNVYGNIVAWVICGGLAITWSARRFIKWNRRRERLEQSRHEERIMELHRLHSKIDKVHEHLGIK
jgi:hypothetical protein